MGETRFVFISDGVDAKAAGSDDRIWWRLVAANNRVLGRSVGTDLGEQECRIRAAELGRRIDEVIPLLTTDARGRWTWTVSLEQVERAQCAHPFPRRVDCQRTLTLFLRGARLADPLAGSVRYFAMRAHSPVTR